jgi:parvulin-like peptidyl-prolyl isomerase
MAKELHRLYDLSGGNLDLIQQYASQQLSYLQSPALMGEQVLDQMEEDLIIAQGAEKLGITVDDAAVDEQMTQYMASVAGVSLPPSETATPTLIPTTTATPLVSPTPDAAVKSTPTITPVPTATLAPGEIMAILEQTTADFYREASEWKISRDTVRAVFHAEAVYEAVQDQLSASVPADELQVNARHILLAFHPEDLRDTTPPTDEQKAAARVRAEEVLMSLQNGEPFADLARSLSNDMGSASQGGELGWANPDQYVAAFRDAVLNAPIGEIVGPVETEYGYHLIQVEGREVRSLTANEIWTRQRQAFDDWLDSEKSRATIHRQANWSDFVPDTPTYDDLLGDIMPSDEALAATVVFKDAVQTATAESITPVPSLEIVLVPGISGELVTQDQLQADADIIELRLQALGVADAVLEVSDASRITIRVTNARDTQSIVAAATQMGLLEFVDFSMITGRTIPDGSCILTTEQVTLAESRLPEGTSPLAYADYACPSQDPNGDPEPALLNDGQPYQTIMTGAGIDDAAAVIQGTIGEQWAVNFVLAKDGDRVQDFIDYVAHNVNHPMAIVLDGRLLSYPTIQSGLAESAAAGTMDGGIITGNFSKAEAQLLAAQLTMGMLPIPLQVESIGEQ